MRVLRIWVTLGPRLLLTKENGLMSRIYLGTQIQLGTAGRYEGGQAQGAGMKQDGMKGFFREQEGTLQSLLRWEAELSSRKASLAGM